MATIVIIMSDDRDSEIMELRKSVNRIITNQIHDLNEEHSDLQKENQDLKQKIKSLEQTIKELSDEQSNIELSSTPPVDCEREYEYLYQISRADGGTFGRVQKFNDDSSNYRMFNNNGQMAEYEFCGDPMEALQKSSSVLDIVADYDGNPETSTQIENVSPGKIEYDTTTGRWKVTKKVKLKVF